MSELYSKRRLQVLSIAIAVVTCALVFRLIDVQIAKHEYYLTKAKKQWQRRMTIPARRGNIFDCNGVPLAVTRWTYTIGVTPKYFPTNDRKAVELLADACNLSQRELRRRLARDDSYVLLGKDLHLTEAQASKLSSYSALRLDPSHDRLYPFESMPPQLVGAINPEGKGIAGVERAFQDVLGGEDGWVLASRFPGDPRGLQPVNGPGRDARNGNDLYLTIDTRIQAIVDFELAQAVERYGAAGGMAIVLEPSTGSILAIAERPVRELSRESEPDGFALRSINGIYEPGSTFKLVTDSYLLEKGKVDPYDAFYGEMGTAKFEFGVFHDDHEHGWLTFKESFVYSSNICTIKAVLGSDPADFYRHLLVFGFGGRTGVELPAESRGWLRPPDEWRARSLPSIAIGHEIGVTAIQMAMAYGALANGGDLLVPRVASDVRDAKGQVVRRFEPAFVRRLFSKTTAATMQDFCRDVVLKGTGRKASANGIPVAGKTGTSQKAIGGVYQPGKYVTSFIGFAPASDPSVVCLVVLDEPIFPYYWGGESSAVVFGRIIEDINISTDIFYGESSGELAAQRRLRGKMPSPSFLRLTTDQAIDLAAEYGLHVRCPNVKGTVYSQTPDPGTLVDRKETITLMIRGQAAADTALSIPDLRGLSIREARRLLLASGLACIVRGFGVVERHEPVAGVSIARGGSVILYCGPRCSDMGVEVAATRNGARN
jgi:stage V sporulation protein D (sporulation-specific penicillin-binding protein)